MRILIILTALLVAAPAFAQSIYKCPLPNGRFEYTDVPCTGPHAQVIHKATKAEVAAQQQTRDAQAMAYMLRHGQVAEAQDYATTHHVETLYNNVVAELRHEAAIARQQQQRRAAIAREMERQEREGQITSLQEQVAEQQQTLDQQNAALQQEQQRSAALRARARAAQNAAAAAAAEAQTPKFNPQSGKWCQTIGGVVQCW